MKIDFRKIVVYDIEDNVLMKEVEKRDSEGNVIGTEMITDYKDLSKDLGNVIFFNVSDINEREIGRKIYHEMKQVLPESRDLLSRSFMHI